MDEDGLRCVPEGWGVGLGGERVVEALHIVGR